MHALLESIINITINFINEIGYVGIFIGMFLESTLFPIPSELVMIPAGMAAASGSVNIYLVTIAGILGNISGAVFSYYLALFAGRPILLKIGKYFFVKEATIVKIEQFFDKHGSISIFIGRLLPGFRHFISLPAGIAKMNFKLFLLFTSLGSTIWTSVLSFSGYFIGHNQEVIKNNIEDIARVFIAGSVVLVIFYISRRIKIARSKK